MADSGRVESASDCVRTETSYNGIIQPLLTDMYQITMAYAYWKSGRVEDVAVFDLFFRRSPFKGEFTIFAGLEQCLHFMENFRYTESDIAYLKTAMPPTVEDEFFEFLENLTTDDVTLYAVEEGTVVFPRVPLMTIKGPLITVQLLETTFLNLVNFSSLMVTNAARYRFAAGEGIQLLEFGLRRAQGPDGGLSASKYAYIGGFDGTSNVLAGKLYGIPVKGTHAHAYISTFSSLEDLKTETLCHKETGEEMNFKEVCLEWRSKLAETLNIFESEASDGEMSAFVSFAIAFPEGFIALVDTYDVLKSGILNYCAVALGLWDFGYKPIGIRIDSGDLAYLSRKTRKSFQLVAKEYDLEWFEDTSIIASNDINEETILSLNEQGHSINCFGIGTHLVTCQRQPALGCVFKLVQINDTPKIKLSQDVEKVTCPGMKMIFRLYGSDGHALVDLMQRPDEAPPALNSRILCRHPFQENKRAFVNPSKVENLHKVFWADGKLQRELPTLEELKTKVSDSLKTLRQDHKRHLNPTPYKTDPKELTETFEKVMVALSNELYQFLHNLWLENAPIGELS